MFIQPYPVPPAPEMPLGPPVMPPPKRSMDELVMLIAGAVLGIAIFGGLLAYHLVFFIPQPTTGGYTPTTDPNVLAYRSTVRLLGMFSMGVLDFAVGFAITLAWFVGLGKKDIPDSARRGVFIFATVFLAVWILFSTTVVSLFFSLIRFY